MLQVDESFLGILPESFKADAVPFSLADESDNERIDYRPAITEPAIYGLALLSKKETTIPGDETGEKHRHAFTSWLLRDVLPNIRKVGAHCEPALIPTNAPKESYSQALRQAADAYDRLEQLVETF